MPSRTLKSEILTAMLENCQKSTAKIPTDDVHTKTRSELERAGTSWNHLERGRINWNELDASEMS